jgi:very-short-patch-repair endonuclease
MTDALTIDPDIRGEASKRGVDRVIARLSERQHGVVARRQILRAGVTRRAIDHRCGLGRLYVLHRGVYAIGNRILTVDGRRMAAILAAGCGAAASHRTAGSLWGVLRSSYLEVTVPTPRRRPGIRIHTSSLPADELATVRGIPITDVSRTLFDLAAVLGKHDLERAMNEAEALQLASKLSLADLISRYPRRAGTRRLKQILDRLQAGVGRSKSQLESRFAEFVRARDLPRPETNVLVMGFECDCVWPERRLIVELDGRAVHDTPAAFERDRARDRALSAGGWRTVRVTWRQLELDPDALTADLSRILAL